jgi:UDP-N-acetylglucosamine 2-epimerase (non-hydrolysing)
MRKVVSVVGARPNFMKVAPIHRAFLPHSDEVEHVIVHTGQHYDAAMSDAFFRDLDMPNPAVFLGVGSGSHAEQTARVMVEFDTVCRNLQPDMVLVVGDVNSTIACSLTAVKHGIRVAHVEAGLRSFDRSMPEEINRIATDAISDYFFVTEQSGLDNLLQENKPEQSIFFVGNTMIDSLHYALPFARESGILHELGLVPNEYVLVTLHRPSNVDEPEQLKAILLLLAELSTERQVIVPLHPRTRKNIEMFGLGDFLTRIPRLQFLEPQGYIRFLALMMHADYILTDSGGIQEETTALGVPCITMRTTTERPVTCELGTNILVDPQPAALRRALEAMLTGPRKSGTVPPLWDGRASERIVSTVIELFHNRL